ncbi:DUF5696 domain-containing protein, partial [Haploplasma modicum]|uniref:DUF5696 domain-containing protein n=1 Tax=Haploplasma modicum TaxID=2150 RepID=UPI00214CCD68
KINEISLYPMFGAENRDLNNLDRGYLVVPDGSGAVINFDNGKGGETNAYKRRIYGQDLALLPSQKVDRENLIFPLFGLVTGDTGFAAVITEGEAMAYINANVSSERNPFNTINTSFALREIETITIGSSISAYTVILATNDIVNTDFSVKYYLLDNNTNSYSGIASMYKQYLIDEHGLEIKDNTTNPKLTLELLGAFDRKKFALGVPYTKQESLTTFKQANIIINDFIEKNINDINILYNGAINGGLSQNIANKTKIEKALGGKKEFMKLEKTLDNKGIDIFVTTKIAGV